MHNYVITWLDDDSCILNSSSIEAANLVDALRQAAELADDVDEATQVFIEVEA